MNEVAQATVCFSRAWREGMYGVSAYWINPEQVKKSAPSGEFLPKGEMTLIGPPVLVVVYHFAGCSGCPPNVWINWEILSNKSPTHFSQHLP